MTRPNTASEMASTKMVALRQLCRMACKFQSRCIAHLRTVAPKDKVVDAMELLPHTEDFKSYPTFVIVNPQVKAEPQESIGLS